MMAVAERHVHGVRLPVLLLVATNALFHALFVVISSVPRYLGREEMTVGSVWEPPMG